MIALLDMVGANSRSLRSSLNRIAVPYKVVKSAKDFSKATHVILAGVSTAQTAMDAICKHNLREPICELTVPVLGICSGMQILFEASAEGGHVPGLGIIEGVIQKLPYSKDFSIPHSGWNQLKELHPSPFSHLAKEYVYFVHSYAAPVNHAHTLLYVDYMQPIPAMVRKDNFFGVQFHPEKSAEVGEEMLREFSRL